MTLSGTTPSPIPRLASGLFDLGRRAEAREWLARAKAIHSTHKELDEQYRKPLSRLESLLLQGQ